MKAKTNITKAIAIGLFIALLATPSIAQVIDNPKASLELAFKQDDGTNASGLTYDPSRELFYCVIAGNKLYPLEVFDKSGKNVFQTEAGIDMRGIWWNKKSKCVEGNGYGDGGIVSMKLDDRGYPSLGSTTLFEGSHQPDGQSVGTFDGKKTIYYFNGERIYKYSRKTGEEIGTLEVGVSGSVLRNMNYTTVIYTGKKKMELGLLDNSTNKVHLINKKTGEETATVQLPDDATTHGAFRFGFAADYVFIYSTVNRSWKGYRIFE